jgi:outer membrane immunogenic protein
MNYSLRIGAACAALSLFYPAAGFAQTRSATTGPGTEQQPPAPPANTSTPDAVTAPDGSDAFGFEPYVAILGGYADYDRTIAGIPNLANGDNREGALVEGVVGANIPLGAMFVGVEGNVAKGIDGAIDWQYGVAGRVGFRAGESGLIYGKVGYEWVNFTDDVITGGRDFGDEIYGLGVEIGPREIGLGGVTGESGLRLRLEVTTRDFESIRPMAGVVFHF